MWENALLCLQRMYTQLPNDSKKYCLRCLAERQDRIDIARENTLKIVGGVVGAVGIAVAGPGKKVIQAILKFK